MTEPRTPATAICLHCGVEFKPHKAGHLFCSVSCRHRGQRSAEERPPIDHDAVARLFDPSRDPEDRVLDDDWISPGCAVPELRALYAVETVEQRRRWYLNLRAGEGRVV